MAEERSAWDKLGDFLFGSAALKAAAGQGKKSAASPAPSPADYQAAKKRAQNYADEVKARQKRQADELAIPRAKPVMK